MINKLIHFIDVNGNVKDQYFVQRSQNQLNHVITVQEWKISKQ